VTPKNLRGEPHFPTKPLDDPGHRPGGQPPSSEAAMAIDGSEQRPARDAAREQPASDSRDRAGRRVRAVADANIASLALLVSLGPADGHDRALRLEGDVPTSRIPVARLGPRSPAQIQA
jgi:hypothetical protein